MDAERFATEWYEAWNAHDLDRVLSHYGQDVVFSSPFVTSLTGRADGTLRGRDELRAYFGRTLERFPDLRFEPFGLFQGAGTVVLHYRSVQGLIAAEAMRIDGDAVVSEVMANYCEPT